MIELNKYPDGSSYVKLNLPESIANTFKINSYEDLWHLNQYVDAQNNVGTIPLITIPNLIDAQADRRFNIDKSFGLKLVCQFLNNMKANFKIFHPHNPEVVEALMDNVEIIDNTGFINEVLPQLKNERHPARLIDEYFKTTQGFHIDKRVTDNLILMSSDAGGFKPLMKLCDNIGWKGETYSASKYRSPENSKLIQIIDRQNFDGKDILIVDDICVSGGTFKGLAKMLRERNCGKLYLAVSHMTVQNLGEDLITNYFDKVFTTNSKYDWYSQSDNKRNNWKKGFKNLEIIKMF